MNPIVLPYALATLASAAAAWTDRRSGLMPNWLTFSGIGLGFLLALLNGGWRGLLYSVLGCLAAALVPLILFRFRAMGGGDVKLFAALGALLGPGVALEAQFSAFVFGSLQGVWLWARTGCLRSGLVGIGGVLVSPFSKRAREKAACSAAGRTELRFGPAVLCGTLVAVLFRSMG